MNSVKCKSASYFVFLLAMEAVAVTIRVPADYASIQAAIDAATTNDLVLVSPGIYNEGLDFSGKAITVASSFYVTGNPTNILNTVIFPSANVSGVTAASGEGTNSKLIGFTISGCSGLNAAGAYCYQGSLSIYNCRIISNQCRGVIMYKSQSVLRDCEIYGNASFDGGGPYDPIHCAQSGPIIENNRIYATDPNGNLEAIYHSTTEAATNLQTVIRSNVIFGTLFGEFHQGGPVHEISYNVFIAENGTYAAIGIVGADEGLHIFNNTLIRVDFSVQLDATPRFYNNIMAYGDYGISVPLFAPRPMIAYNCIWQTQQPIPNEFMTNGNIFVNPRFVDVLNRDFRLLADSPCIDGGNPMSPADPDATRADQGAFVFDQRYQAWLQRYFSSSILADTNAEQTIWGLTADPDFDRALNLYEYFSGCDPLNADSDLQQLKLNLVGTNSVLTFRKSKRIVGITNELQGADILPIWNPTSAAELPLAELGGAFIFQTKVSNTGKDGQFFRMEVGLLP